VKYEKISRDGDGADLYTMDHTSSLYLMAPDGSFVTRFAHGISAQTLADELTQIIR